MEKIKDSIGEIFVNGRVINLDKANIEELEIAIDDLKKQKVVAVDNFNKIVQEVNNI